jgi:hypothetical protein
MAKNKKTVNFILPLIIYPFDVMVSMGETDEQLKKTIKRYSVTEKELDEISLIGSGRYCLFECGASLLRTKTIPTSAFDFGVLQHEIFHATVSVLWKIGMKLEINVSDEAYAYLAGYLTEQIYKRIGKAA